MALSRLNGLVCMTRTMRRERISICSSRVFLIFIFFFSSRRRHTRWNCDWSSDVCSSDLASVPTAKHFHLPRIRLHAIKHLEVFGHQKSSDSRTLAHTRETLGEKAEAFSCRSEERRVGKECRSRWSPYN